VVGNIWDAEHAVTPEVARRLLAGQFPDLALDSVELLGIGWDNTVYLVDGTWAVRFPRRAMGAELFAREIALLPSLAPLLPLPVPVPELVGAPADGYPWPFWGGRLVPGVEVCEAALTEDGREALATDVGALLRALHDPAVARTLGTRLPSDPMKRATPSTRGPMARENLDKLVAAELWQPRSVPDRAADELIARTLPMPPPTGEPVLVHGDLHLRHLMVGPDGRASGVIDWGDACLADPSVDLTVAYAVFSGPSRDALFAAYGRTVAEDQHLRARVLGLNLCSALAVYAESESHPTLLAESLAGLHRALI
jgi:aminoglycoside phosphotransferase (APT) family kinase protein